MTLHKQPCITISVFGYSFISIMNTIPIDIKDCIFYNLIHDKSIVSLRKTSKEHNKIVDCILRKEYEDELCKLFESFTISRRMENGKCKIKDILRKEFLSNHTCDIFHQPLSNFLKKALLGPVISTCITFIIIYKFYKK